MSTIIIIIIGNERTHCQVTLLAELLTSLTTTTEGAWASAQLVIIFISGESTTGVAITDSRIAHRRGRVLECAVLGVHGSGSTGPSELGSAVIRSAEGAHCLFQKVIVRAWEEGSLHFSGNAVHSMIPIMLQNRRLAIIAYGIT